MLNSSLVYDHLLSEIPDAAERNELLFFPLTNLIRGLISEFIYSRHSLLRTGKRQRTDFDSLWQKKKKSERVKKVHTWPQSTFILATAGVVKFGLQKSP
jgi:hypothetical protein